MITPILLTRLKTICPKAALAPLIFFGVFSTSSSADDISKANNTTALDLTGSWTGGVVPTLDDVAVYSSAVTPGKTSGVGAGVSFGGIKYSNNPGGNIAISANGSNTLTLGANGIDLSAGSRTFSITAPVVLDADQTWTTGTTGNSTTPATQITVTGVISGTGQLSISGADGSPYTAVHLNALNTFSGGLVLNSGGSIRLNSGTPTFTGGVPTASSIGTGNLTINGGTIYGGGGTLAPQLITVNNDFAVNYGTSALNGRLTIGGGTVDLTGGTRTVSLGRFVTPTGAVTGGSESLRFVALAGAPATLISNGTLRFVRSSDGTATDFVGVSLGTSTNFAAGSGLVIGANVITTMSTGQPFGTTQATLPYLTVESGGYFNMASAISAYTPHIRSLSGNGVVTSLANAAAVSTSTLTINSQSGDTATFSGQIVNGSSLNVTLNGTFGTNVTVALTKSGLGTQILSGENTYTGATIISGNGGTLQIGDGGTTGSLSTSSAISVGSSSVLAFNRSNTVTQGADFASVISGAGSVTQAGLGTLVLSGNNTYTGGTALNAGTVQVGHANGLGSSGTITFGGGTLQYGSGITTDLSSRFSTAASQAYNIDTNGNDVSFAGNLTSSGGTLLKTGSGNLTLSGANNSYDGGTTISGGTLKGGVGSGNLTVDSGATYDLNSANRIAGTLGGAGNITLGSSTFTSNSSTDSTFSGLISGAGGGLTKNGTGTLSLSGNNTYTGATTLNAGTLAISGNIAASATTVNSGGTLTGTGTVGAITLNAGGLVGAGVDTASVGTLSGSSLTIGAGSGYALTIGNVNAAVAGTDYDQISLSGALTLNNTLANPFTVSLYGTPTGWSDSGSYNWDIITAGSLSGAFSAGNFTTDFTNFGIAVGNRTGSWSFSNPSDGNIRLTYTASAGASIWSGGSGDWDLGFSPPISNDVSITFNGTGGTATNNIDDATLDRVASITFASEAGAYTLEADSNSAGGSASVPLAVGGAIVNNSSNNQAINLGLSFSSSRTVDAAAGNMTLSGSLSGTGGLVKDGNYTLTLSANNTYTGATTINAGTLEIAAAGRLGGGNYTAAISNNANIIFSGTTNQSLTGVISGTGGITMNGSEALTINATNIYSGGTVLNSGTLLIQNASALGTGTLTINGGNLNQTTGSGLTLANNPQIWNGNFSVINSNSLNLGSGAVTVNENITVTVNANTFTVGGVISGDGYNLTKAGNGILSLGNANSTVSSWTVNEGTLRGGVNTGTFGYGATLNLVSGTLTAGPNQVVAADFSSNALNILGDFTLNNNGPSNNNPTTWYQYKSLAIGSNTLNVTASGNTADGNISIRDGVTLNGNATINVTGTLNAMTFTSNGSVEESGGSYGLTKAGNGTLRIVGAANYTGDTLISGGVLEIQNIAASALSGNTTLNTNFVTLASTEGILVGQQVTGTGIRAGSYILAINSANSTITLSQTASATGSNVSLTFAQTAGSLAGSTLYYDNQGGSINFGQSTAITLGGLKGSQNLSLTNSNSAAVALTIGANNQTTTYGGVLSGNGSLVKTGTGTFTLSGNNTYSGATTINTGTIQIGNGGTSGSIASTSGVTNNSVLAYNRSDDLSAAYAISGTGALIKNGAGMLTLSGNNSYSGGTTLHSGTIVIGHANAAGTGTITQASGSSLLKIDTTGTITNDMSVYNVIASQSATLSGAITVNNATWDIDTGDTLTISGMVSGNGGVTKNGGGTLVLSGNNTYLAPTVITAGTLNATSANALGSNNTVQVTGGTLLVSADDAINGKNITLNTNGVGLQFSGNYSGAIGSLTLSANSIIDLGPGSVQILFQGLTLSGHTLSFYNWTGSTLWNGGTGADTDKVFLFPTIDPGDLNKISFYSGNGGDSFLGTGFDIGLEATGFSPAFGNQIIPVPEPETWAVAVALLIGGVGWMWRRKSLGKPIHDGLEGPESSS